MTPVSSPTPDEQAVRAFFDAIERFGRSDAGLRIALDAALGTCGDLKLALALKGSAEAALVVVREQLTQALARLAAMLELHRRVDYDSEPHCAVCITMPDDGDYEPWPCLMRHGSSGWCWTSDGVLSSAQTRNVYGHPRGQSSEGPSGHQVRRVRPRNEPTQRAELLPSPIPARRRLLLRSRPHCARCFSGYC